MDRLPHTPAAIFDAPLPGGGRVALDVAGPALLRLRLTRKAAFAHDLSYAVIEREWPRTETEVEHRSDAALDFRTASLRGSLRLDPFSLRVQDLDGRVRFETADRGLQWLDEGIALARRLPPGEGVYGLGEHGETFNRVPGVYRFWNTDDFNHQPFRQYYCNIPFCVAHEPGGPTHGALLDNPGELFFRIGRPDPDRFICETRAGELRLWLMFENSPAAALARYADLTGRMERPPLWPLGYQQCRWSYMSAERAREVAREFRRRRIPCDVIYLDIDYMDRFRVFTWNPETFPDPEGLLGALAEKGFSPVCIVDPAVARADYFACSEGRKIRGFFLRTSDGREDVVKVWPGESLLPDFTDPEVRRVWGEWQARELLDKGVAGIWNDMNEPALFPDDAHENQELDPGVRHHDMGLGRTHREIHNVYGMQMARASCEGQRARNPDRRPFTLTRSGWAGVQRWSAVWTGDNRSAFSCMPLDIALNLNMGMSGVPFVGCDIGGFANDATPELFARWMEWGVFQPFCRGHSAMGTIDQEPWVFGKRAERVAREMIEWRYRLLPYLYTLMVEASETGMPVNRPLILEYPDDARAASIGDQFLVGRDLLVAPVLQSGADHRSLYLPEGEWRHFWTGRRFEGGGAAMVEAPLGRPPVFVRAGAAIPMHPVRQHTREPEPETTIVEIWPGERIDGRLVEDDGLTLAWRRGEECRIAFSGACDGDGLRFTLGRPEGLWRPARTQWELRIHAGDRQYERAELDGRPVDFERREDRIVLAFPDDRTKPRSLILK